MKHHAQIINRTKSALAVTTLFALVMLAVLSESTVQAGQPPAKSGYQVLAPISHGNLTIFPVVSANVHEGNFLTLDEGLRSGEVVVTEAGSIQPLIRRYQPRPLPRPGGAQVNNLMLVNNSDRPLLLLAGEIVTGGKQDRVVGKDRIIPAKSDPVDLAVFCVEPGRWVEKTNHFNGLATMMAQPSVRRRAMADKDQSKVWSEVRGASAGMATAAPAAGDALQSTTSYATVMENRSVQKQVDSVAAPIQHSYETLIRALRERNAVGVVVAVNGRIIWADIFANPRLLEKYWQKLVRSYATEAIVTASYGGNADIKSADAFLQQMNGRREVVETEPGVYRHAEMIGAGYKVFELTSLLSKNSFAVHTAKMVEAGPAPLME